MRLVWRDRDRRPRAPSWNGCAADVSTGIRDKMWIVPGGFEPPSWAPKAHMIGHYTTGLHLGIARRCLIELSLRSPSAARLGRGSRVAARLRSRSAALVGRLGFQFDQSAHVVF